LGGSSTVLMIDSSSNSDKHYTPQTLLTSRFLFNKSTPIRDVLANHLIYYPTPGNLNYF